MSTLIDPFERRRVSHPPVIPRGNRFRREGRYSEGRESGLTGNPDIPDPPSEGPTDLRARLARIRQAVVALVATLPRVLGLVWSASRILTIGLAIATILGGVVPAITAYIAKLLVDAVVRAIARQRRPEPAGRPSPSGRLTVDAVGTVVLLAAAQFAGLRGVVVPVDPPERLPAAAPGAGHEHDPAPDHGARREAGPRLLRGFDLLRPAPASAAGRRKPAAVHGQRRVRADPDDDRLRHDDRAVDRAQPVACRGRAGRPDPGLHRRHPLRLARLQLRALGLAAPTADGLPDDARDDRHVRQGGQAVRPRAVLHRSLPDAVQGLPGPPARSRGDPLLRRVRVERDHDPGRLVDLSVRGPPGDRRQVDPR